MHDHRQVSPLYERRRQSLRVLRAKDNASPPKPVPALHTCSPPHSLLRSRTSARIMAYHLGDPSAPSEIVSLEPNSNRSAESRGILSMSRFRRFRMAALPACFFVASISLLAQSQQPPQQQQTPPPTQPPQQPKPPAPTPPVNPFETAPRVQQTPPQPHEQFTRNA